MKDGLDRVSQLTQAPFEGIVSDSRNRISFQKSLTVNDRTIRTVLPFDLFGRCFSIQK